MNRDLVERLQSCFGYIGPRNRAVPSKFLHHARADFIHASISPCFLQPDSVPSRGDLSELAAHVFHGYAGPTANLYPFFSVVGGPDEHAAVGNIAADAGWVMDQ